ncbi:MAG: IS110 family transposase [Gammaproteobacteria bacterium]|nr:IS110 family transposase [Gammaproteobacteria bacterium]NIR60680.1 IS110 family transposase [Gammaproteobacteria bacterium]
MAKRVVESIVGVDTGKSHFDLHYWEGGEKERIDNRPRSIDALLERLPAASVIALEATGTYHEELLDRALRRGFTVYLINGQRLRAYAEATGLRAKTDPSDAELLARFVYYERAQLRPQRLIGADQRRLRRLLKRRALLVEMRTRLRQSSDATAQLKQYFAEVIEAANRAIAHIEHELRALVRRLGWEAEVQLCRSIPGVGELSAIALVESYQRGPFKSIDAFIAFQGLDVRVRQSGRWVGRRKLTKMGDAETRRLLFNAARAAVQRSALHAAYYERLRARGTPTTGAYVAVARKLARQAFGVLRSQTPYRCDLGSTACAAA